MSCVKYFSILKDFLIEIKRLYLGNPKAKKGGSLIKEFIHNGRIYTQSSGDYDYFGFYWWSNSSYLLKWKGKNYYPIYFDDKSILHLVNKFKNKGLDFSSINNFNKQYDNSVRQLDDFEKFLTNIFETIKLVLKSDDILIKEGRIESDAELNNIYLESEIKKVYLHFEIKNNKVHLFFDIDNINLGKLKEVLNFKIYEKDDEWAYFELSIENFEFKNEHIKKIVEFYIEKIKIINNIIR